MVTQGPRMTSFQEVLASLSKSIKTVFKQSSTEPAGSEALYVAYNIT